MEKMRKNSILTKIFSCVLAIVSLLVSLPITSSASNMKLTYVYSYSSTKEEGFWLELLNVDGTAYITADNAAQISGMKKGKENEKGVTFSTGHYKTTFSGDTETFNNVVYYEFQEIMNSLSTRYKYDLEKETLIFNACESFYANLLHDCEEIFEERYDLAYIVNGWGVGVGALYNIIGGFRIDVIWGGYQTEQYETALSGIMQPDEKTDLLDLVSEGNSIMSKLSTAYDLSKTVAEDMEEYCELLGLPFDDYIEAYDILKNAVPGLDIGDFLEIMQSIQNAEEMYEIYVSSVEYGLVENKELDKGTLKTAVKNVYSYYNENKPLPKAVIEDVLRKVGSNITKDGFKEVFLKEIYGANSIYVRAVKLLFDEMGMKEMTKAVEQTYVCSEIQKAAQMKYEISQDSSSYVTVDSYTAKGLRAKNIKYSTILYLRAYQYAYELYAFDEELKWCSDVETERAQNAIEKLMAYSDEDLSRTVINKKLDLSQSGFCDEVKTFDASPYKGYWYGEYEGKYKYQVELTINSAKDNAITYDISFVRLGGFQNQTILINRDGGASFKAYEYEYYMEGTVLFEDDKILMIIKKTNDPYIEIGEIEFTQTFAKENSPSARGLALLLYGQGEYTIKKDDVTIQLFPDYTFKMKINVYEGYCYGTGTYVVSSSGLISCTIKSKDFDGFVGNELEEFSLALYGKQKYQINLIGVEYIGMLFDGDMFVT